MTIMTSSGRAYARTWKPCLDRTLSVVLIVAVAPVLGLIALLVRASLGPGVIFRQQRIGRHGGSFDVLNCSP